MGKSDKKRAGNKNDEQQKLSQSYLTGLQAQLAGQYGNYGNAMFGQAPSPTQNTFGWGTTVPHFGWGGSPYFSGNGTGTAFGESGEYGDRTRPTNSPQTGTATPRYNRADVQAKLMPFLQSLGGADSATLERALPQIQQMFPGTTRDTSGGPLDEIVVPGVGVIDLIKNAETGGQKGWTFQNNPNSFYGANYQVGMKPPSGGGGGGIMGQTMSDYGNLMGQYQNWANTGGLSEMDKANLRGRAISPIRSMYSNAQREMGRTRALQGGYSPGHTAALTRMNRDFGQNASDATLNAEASITDMMRQGKMFGMGGMSNLYGATPGLANTFGNQMLQAMGQQLSAGQLQNQLSNNMMNNQMQQGQMSGFPWEKVLKGIGTGAAILGTGGMAAAPLAFAGGLGAYGR